jgi:RNA polymerase sigma factor (sigma-70 family)
VSRGDEGLAADFAAHAHDALSRAYARYGRLLYSVARHVLGDEWAAEDCVHDALLRAWQSGRYREDRGELHGFLVACVRNQAMTMARSARRRSAREWRAEYLEPVKSTTFEIPDHVELGRLRDALSRLPQEQRSALELAYFGNRTHMQVAAELGVPLGTIKSRIAGGLRRLASDLRAQPGSGA